MLGLRAHDSLSSSDTSRRDQYKRRSMCIGLIRKWPWWKLGNEEGEVEAQPVNVMIRNEQWVVHVQPMQTDD